MECRKLEFPPLGLNELLERISIRSLEGIRPAAEALRDSAMSLTGLRVAPCANIASKEPMVDGNGNILASEVFGWCDPAERWWDRRHLALTSPLTLACRYESEPFWCCADGLHTQHYNPHLVGLDLSDFFERANSTFDSAWVDEQCQPGHGGIPQLFTDFQKRKFDVLSPFVAQMDIIIDVPAAHRP